MSTPNGTAPRTSQDPGSAIRVVLAALRAVARELWHLPDMLRHGDRRAEARRRLAAVAPVRTALFICHGNVCRSPFAEVLFSRLMEERGMHVGVSSAGFIGPERTSPPGALSAAARRRFDISDHRSSLITAERLAGSDLIVVMSAEQERAIAGFAAMHRGEVIVLGDLDPQPISRRTVLDPWGGDDTLFDESYDRIERCIAAMVYALT